MIDATAHTRTRQTAHWRSAVDRLRNLEGLASAQAWQSLESYMGVALRRSLGDAVVRLEQALAALELLPAGPAGSAGFDEFRRHYLRVESVVDFYIDALNTRSSPYMAALLRSCDWLASTSMARLLIPRGLPRPPVLVYADLGLGAAILKAGLRLWDGATENPAAVIRVTFHNVLRPTALVHEAGHQVAHMTGWNEELGGVLESSLPAAIAPTWAGWASEVAADVYAFANCGYASVVALHDVIDGGPDAVYRMNPGDPHPMGYLRLLFAVALCDEAFGRGVWNQLAAEWKGRYEAGMPAAVATFAGASQQEMHGIARLVLHTQLRALGHKSIVEAMDVSAVSPAALLSLEKAAGPSLLTSPHWARTECLRIVALTGYQIGADANRTNEILRAQEAWMLRAGAEWLTDHAVEK